MVNEMCMPNEPDELDRILRQAEYIDAVIAALNPRSPRASGARSLAPSLPDAGSGADSQHSDFERDSQATGV